MKFNRTYYRFSDLLVKGWVWVGVLLGVAYAIILFGFITVVWECARYTYFHVEGWQVPFILSEGDSTILYYSSALTASVFGLFAGFRFALENSIRWRQPRLKLHQRSLINLQTVLFYVFLYILGKALLYIPMFYAAFRIPYRQSVFGSYPILYFLFPLVMFLMMWPPMLRKTGRHGQKWLGFTFLMVSILAAVIAQWRPIDAKRIDDSWLASDVFIHNNIEVPEASSGNFNYRSSLFLGLFISHDGDRERIFKTRVGRYEFEEVTLDSVPALVAMEKARLAEAELVLPVLYIDRNVRMQYVNDLIFRFSKIGVRHIRINTAVPSPGLYDNTLDPTYGMDFIIPFYYAEFETFLNEAEEIGSDNRRLVLPIHHWAYRTESYKLVNHIKVDLSADGSITLNGQSVGNKKLGEVVYSLIKRFPQRHAIVYDVAPEARFEDYIRVKDIIRQQYILYRKEIREQIGKEFDSSYIYLKYTNFVGIAPYEIIELTPGEKRLIRLKERFPVKYTYGGIVD
ncbi:hypothetical protein AB9P05_10900 [Roseivirga sp. BDSF3-8]|uniref:hypothetical protein n=1 Tax=Roseivirga sp. BDSF3-8 TaxID=3241598 RepID=UPI00353232A9